VITLFINSLPRSTTEESLTGLFSQYGTVRSLKLAKDIFSGDCKGFATVSMEGHEARAAIAALDGSEFEGRQIRVGLDRGRSYKRGGPRRR
jgi:RNA recognition motif-containing protein